MTKKQDSSKQKKDSLEASLQQLENIIEEIESGKLSLDQSLSHFEKGIKLSKHCQKILSQAEQKIQILVDDKQLKNFSDNDE